jgi:histidinol phosphatase-like PHP family hydrolase
MIDLHTHTLLSDGALCPAEHIRRAETKGYRLLGISDHADLSTMETILGQVLIAARKENELGRIRVLAGIELTHVRPAHIPEAVEKARALGAAYVIVHGETLVEPVQEGTNQAALEAGCDILAHPGLITEGEVQLAARKGIRLELSGKAGHSLSNGHVAALACRHGASLLFGSDAHEPSQMPTRDQAQRICRGAGLGFQQAEDLFAAGEDFALKLFEAANR